MFLINNLISIFINNFNFKKLIKNLIIKLSDILIKSIKNYFKYIEISYLI